MMLFQEILKADRAELEHRGLIHTPFEIAQQPDLWRDMWPELREFSQSLGDFLAKDRPILLAGAGTSDYAARAVAGTLKKRGWPHVEAVASTELVLDPEALFPRRPFTMISFARSGNSPEGNAAFTLANELQPDVRHIVVTCNADGELARLARELGDDRARLFLLPERSNDKGLAMTSSFTGMVVAGQALAYTDDLCTFENAVAHIAVAADSLLHRQSRAIDAVASLPFSRAVFIGANNHYATALESHLKVQELSDGRIVAKAESCLGIRHGPMSVINDETVVVAFLGGDSYVHQYELDLLRELRTKNLGLHTVVCVPGGLAAVTSAPAASSGVAAALGGAAAPGAAASGAVGWQELADTVIVLGRDGGEPGTAVAHPSGPRVPATPPDHLLVAPAALVGQMLGLMKSVHLGLKPDAPSADDVISRVVQGVTIYPYLRRSNCGGHHGAQVCCGSGKKYKRCCLNEPIIQSTSGQRGTMGTGCEG